jgi:hypothetical protein
VSAADPEVGDADLARRREQEVARADVAMDDRAGQLAVRELEGHRGALHDVRRDAERQPAGTAQLEHPPEARSVDELHDQVHVASIAREVEHAHDVAVMHADEGLQRLGQPLDEHPIICELGKQPLDRDWLLNAVVAEREPREHLRHAAVPQPVAEHVVPERWTNVVRIRRRDDAPLGLSANPFVGRGPHHHER